MPSPSTFRALFDLVGYLAGAVVLAAVLWPPVLRRLRGQPPNVPALPLALVVYGTALLLQTLVMPGADNRVLGFGCLLAGFSANLGKSRWVRWGVNLFTLGVITNAALTLGRPALLNPNLSAAVLLAGLPFGNMPLLAVGLVVTQSRGALLGLTIAGVVHLWPRLTSPRRKALAVAGVFLALGWLVSLRPDTVSTRWQHWGEAERIFSEHWLFGAGPGSYITESNIPAQNHADNALFTIAAEQGLVGVMAFVVLVLGVAWRWHLCRNPLVRLSLLAFAVQQLVDDTWLWPWPALLLGCSFALLWSNDEVPAQQLAVVDTGGGAAGAPAAVPTAALE
jgi:hypothetical protein